MNVNEKCDLERFANWRITMNNFLAWSHVPSLGLLLGCEGIRTKAAPHRNYISHTRARAHTLVSVASFPWPIAIKFSLTVGVIEMLNSISTEWVFRFEIFTQICINIGRVLEHFSFSTREEEEILGKFRERNLRRSGKIGKVVPCSSARW